MPDINLVNRITVNGDRVTPNHLHIKPPKVEFKKETDDSGLIEIEMTTKITALKPEITVNGFPGGVLGFVTFCAGTGNEPIIECWSDYKTNGQCTTKTRYILLQVQILGSDTPDTSTGKVEKQTLQLGNVIRYKEVIDGEELYDIRPLEQVALINGVSVLGN